MTDPCTEHEYHWYPAVNENGWRCCYCEHKPGEPEGYDPKLDRELVETKCHAILSDLHSAGIVYVSNSSHGDSIVAYIVAECGREELYDQYSIAMFILQALQRSHAKYWKPISEGILAGKDPRARCWCGALATIYIGHEKRCGEHHDTPNPQKELAF